SSRATLPSPAKASLSFMSGQVVVLRLLASSSKIVDELADEFEALSQVSRIRTEADSQVLAHSEVLARDNQNVLFFAEAFYKLERADAQPVFQVGDGASLRLYK